MTAARKQVHPGSCPRCSGRRRGTTSRPKPAWGQGALQAAVALARLPRPRCQLCGSHRDCPHGCAGLRWSWFLSGDAWRSGCLLCFSFSARHLHTMTHCGRARREECKRGARGAWVLIPPVPSDLGQVTSPLSNHFGKSSSSAQTIWGSLWLEKKKPIYFEDQKKIKHKF